MTRGHVTERRSGTRTLNRRGSLALVLVYGGWRRVVFENREIARFKEDDVTHAEDFCNGFNAGYLAGRAG